MNQDQVKESLQKLAPNAPDFQVIFTGKSSRKVNGLYKPESREILLHNRNFASDSELLYTAVHEFAHHLHFCSDAPPNAIRAHTKAFWLIFATLLEEAMKAGLYRPTFDDEMTLAIATAKSALVAEAEATKKTGHALLNLVQQCSRLHVRFEDVTDRVLGVSRAHSKKAMAAFAQDVATDGGPDQLALAVKIKDPEIRREIQLPGQTLIEKQAAVAGVVMPKPVPNPHSIKSPVELEVEKLRSQLAILEEKTERIRLRLEDLAETDGSTVQAAHPREQFFNSAEFEQRNARPRTHRAPLAKPPSPPLALPVQQDWGF